MKRLKNLSAQLQKLRATTGKEKKGLKYWHQLYYITRVGWYNLFVEVLRNRYFRGAIACL